MVTYASFNHCDTNCEVNFESNERELFYRIVRSWRSRPDASEAYTLKQIASFSLGKGDDTNAAEIGRTIHGFLDYFAQPAHDGHRWKMRWIAIERDHPNLFYPEIPEPATSDFFREMEQALQDEITAFRKHWRDHAIIGAVKRSIAKLEEGCHWYEAQLDLPDDSEIPVPEGVEVRLHWPAALGLRDVHARLLSYEPKETRIILECSSSLTESQIKNNFNLFPCVEQLLNELRSRLEVTQQKPDLLVHRVLQNGARSQLKWNAEIEDIGLDSSQAKAIADCLNHDFTFLWGPPGTGKTHTLGRLVVSAALAGKRVLVCAISNVAVDQVALKVLDALVVSENRGESLLETGRVLRFGHPHLNEVSGEPRLFPNRTRIQELRRELHSVQQKHRDLPQEKLEERAVLQSELQNLKKALKELTKTVIHESSIVLTTAVQTCIEPAFHDKQFDFVIVDEASMMPIPYLVATAGLSSERIVVAGDFRQLGPISLAQSKAAHDWLHRDPFEMVGIQGSAPSHPALAMLTTQRRMNEGICSLINKPFYEGQLVSAARPNDATGMAPLPGEPVVLVRVLPTHGSELCQTSQGSRMNRKTAEVTAVLVLWYLNSNEHIKIGVVTPYRGQVAEIKKLLGKSGIDSLSLKRVTVGTIHAFQGSESDVIIWDLVDTRDATIGKLYHSDMGDRVGNVAVSRAKGKLLVVGDENAFFIAPGREKIGRLKFIFLGLRANDYSRVIDLEDLSIFNSAVQA